MLPENPHAFRDAELRKRLCGKDFARVFGVFGIDFGGVYMLHPRGGVKGKPFVARQGTPLFFLF